jgi:hypothetical protein
LTIGEIVTAACASPFLTGCGDSRMRSLVLGAGIFAIVPGMPRSMPFRLLGGRERVTNFTDCPLTQNRRRDPGFPVFGFYR